jgi:outer membrane protein W
MRFIFLWLLISSSSSVFAQTGRLGFFINAAGFFPQQKNIKDGFGSGIGVILHFNPRISVSLEWKYSQLRIGKEEDKFLDGKLTMTPLVASFQYHLSTRESFYPYVFAGGGLFFNSFRLNKQINLQETNIRKQNVKNGLGFYGGIGTSFKLKESLFVFIEGLYLLRTTDGQTLYLDDSSTTSFRVNLSSLSVLIGLKYRY